MLHLVGVYRRRYPPKGTCIVTLSAARKSAFKMKEEGMRKGSLTAEELENKGLTKLPVVAPAGPPHRRDA
jgi:hypothetical protein